MNRRGWSTVWLVVVIAAGLVWWKFQWQGLEIVPTQTITVVGRAKSLQKNQIATFSAGVEAVGDNKDLVVKEVNDKVAVLVKAIKDFGINEGDIKTQSISIYQGEEPYWENGVQKSRKSQWRVGNTVEVTLREVDKTSVLTDLLSKSGATNVYGPNFSFNDTAMAEKEIFGAAMKDARERAEELAKNAGRKLGKVYSVKEGVDEGGINPVFRGAEGMGGGGATEVGTGTVSVNLTVVFEVK